MFRKPILLGAVALSTFAVPAIASAPLAITMPAALPLVAVGATHAECASYNPNASYSSSATRLSKTRAILGGQPSALEALKRQQEGAGNSILSPTNSILSPAAPAAPATVSYSASYTPALPLSAISTVCIGQIGGQLQGPLRSPVLRSPFPPPARSTGAFLGTERVAIGRTRFDADWNRVAGRGLSRRGPPSPRGRGPR
ncbi:MAG TPA: hypothetical protein DCS24_09465, partial [Erythrobacter sp.]|nr:hypothetical protein [Erythrobacter sp.]